MLMGGKRHPPATLPLKRDPEPIVKEAGQAQGPYFRCVENLTSNEIRSPDRLYNCILVNKHKGMRVLKVSGSELSLNRKMTTD
jgi:hypothetical protein